MADENVVPIPNPSQRLVIFIARAQQQYATSVLEEARGRQSAIRAIIDYGKGLLEGRADYKRNTDFKRWVKDNKFDQGKPWNDSRERTAAMQIAKIVNGTGTVNTFADCPHSAPTNIMSWYRKKHPEKVRTKRAPKTPKPVKESKADATRKGLDAIKAMEANKEPITEGAIAEKAGIAAGTANKAYTLHRETKAAVEEAVAEVTAKLTEDQLLTKAEAGFSDKQKVTLKHAGEIYKKRIYKGYREDVRLEALKLRSSIDEHKLKEYERLSKMETSWLIERNKRGVFTKLEFRQLQMCVHPDNTASVEVRNRMLDILVKNETRLLKE